jgi:hypothetical protein
MAAEFRNYLVVQTPETLRRFQGKVAPGVALTDQAAAERIAARWQLRPAPEQAPAYANPTLILAGRQDATVGYAGCGGCWSTIRAPPLPCWTVPAMGWCTSRLGW